MSIGGGGARAPKGHAADPDGDVAEPDDDEPAHPRKRSARANRVAALERNGHGAA